MISNKNNIDDLEVIETGKPKIGIIKEMQAIFGERKWATNRLKQIRFHI